MCLMFALLDCLFSKETDCIIQQILDVRTILNVKMNFSLQNLQNLVRSKWDIYTPVHCILNWCQLHQLPCILHNEETRDNTVDYIFHSQLNKLLLNFSDYLIWNLSQLVVICHVHLCILLITLFFFIIAENTSQHFKLWISGD